MQRNLEEIISYMNEQFRPYEVFETQIRRITRELIERGYTLDEITRGVNTYLLHLEPVGSDHPGRQKEVQKRDRNFRILDVTESRWIGAGAYGYLCQLRELGLLNSQETEELIGYVVENEIELESRDDLQEIMLELIFDGEMEEEVLSSDDDYEDEQGRFPFLPRKNRRLL